MERTEKRLNWRQACAILGCSRSHFYNLVNSGELPAERYGKRDFDFIAENHSQWADRYHSERSVDEASPHVDGLAAALSKFTLKSLAAGYAEPIEGGKKYRIAVSRLAVFVHDVFNFEHRPWSLDSNLGWWSCEKKRFSWHPPSDESYRLLHNFDFQKFQSTHKKGMDFDVYSLPRELVDYEIAPYEYTWSEERKCQPPKK